MIISLKDLYKLFAISIVTCCAVFVCALFLNYNIDILGIEEQITSPQGIVMYDAQVSTGKVVVSVSGGCLIITTVIMLIFYIKNYIDAHKRELGILKAMGYSDIGVAKHFWVFGLNVFIGSAFGYTIAWFYMPYFYNVQNDLDLLPQMQPEFHFRLVLCLIVVPVIFFMLLAVLYGFIKIKSPVIGLLRDEQKTKVNVGITSNKGSSFLTDLRKNTLRGRKILVFFVGFSAFCFSSMTQMSMSMEDLSSESFSWMLISIGLILAFMTLLMSLTSVIKANAKTIAMMKVFGYSKKECSGSILGGYRPVSYIGFVVGTLYQYLLLKIVVNIVFADFQDMPEYNFNWKALLISFLTFIAAYELVIYYYSGKISRQSVKSIMLE